MRSDATGTIERPAMKDEPISDPSDYFGRTRQSLLSRMRDWDDRESWRTFFDTYGKFIFNIARKAGLTESEAEEVVQETILGVARKIPEFQYDRSKGTFKGWLAQLTRWRIADQLRKRGRAGDREVCADEDGEALLDRLPDEGGGFDALWDAEWRDHVLRVATERVKAEIHPRQFQMFELAALQNWPVREIAKMLGVSAAQIYMAKMRVTRLIKAEVRALEREAE